ncbi:MAG TPA: CoA transferase [Dehalococcoidia bacterium]|nr:CoA transferase [Dehalococcoidia bacterium]
MNEPETNGLPLDGIRVLDLTSVWAMPYAAGVLTDLGAEVIKIEALQRLDQNRELGVWPDTEGGFEPWNNNGTFSVLNRGKRSITLNLAHERGRDAFRELVKISDVVLENYTARVMRGWELDFAHLSELRPGLIMVSNTGYGHGGPWESYAVQGTALESTTGIANFSGYRGGRPWTVGQSYPDFVAMWHGLFCIMAALRRRTLTGEGHWIDLGMYQTNVSLQGEAMLDYVANGRLGERLGNRDHTVAVQGCYQTLGDDRWIVFSAQSDAEWGALSAVLGEVDWDEEPPTTLAEARARHDEVDGVVGAWAATRSREDAVEALRGAGLAAGPVNDARDLFLDPQVRERGLYEWVQHARGTGVGLRPIIGRAFRLSETPLHVRGPAPSLGEANAYVFKELLGMSDEQFDAMVEQEITGTLAPLDEARSGLPIDALLGARRIRVHDPDYIERLQIIPEEADGSSSS